MPDPFPAGDVALLVSGGLESAFLCVDLLRRSSRVCPLYVRFGLRWEEVELAHLRRFLQAVARPGLGPLVVLDEPGGGVYDGHWSAERRKGFRDAGVADPTLYAAAGPAAITET